jgi:signal transduction histidine kinase
MKNKPWLGILAAGPMSPALFRISNLHVYLGPVAAASLRVASRLANRLKAGVAVQPEALAEAELILITGPEADFADLLHLAISAGMDWKGRTAVLLDFRRDASDLAPLQALGASTGTLDSLDSFSDLRFVADVDPLARRRIQRLATAGASSIFYLDQGRKQVFTAGTAFTGTLLAPLVASAVDCLKKAGLTPAEAISITERNTLQTLRSALKSGRKGWAGAVPDGGLENVRQQLPFGKDPGWLIELAGESSPTTESMDDAQTHRFIAAGRLAANLAHDWDNALTLLAAHAREIAHSLPPDHPAQTLTSELNKSLQHAADSPRRLLNWLRHQPCRLAPIDLNDVIRASIPLLQIALGRGVQCETHLTETPLILPLDQPLFLNAMLNLASNASIAMANRGTFTVRTETYRTEIKLIVEDTGSGMDEITRQRVFDPFFSTRHAKGGAGLGMETVKSLVQSHRATVSIHSAPTEGCRFTFVFQK